MRFLLGICVFLFSTFVYGNKPSAPFVGNSIEGIPCVGRAEGYGPFDYLQKRALAAELQRVEAYHFTPNVEALVRGESTTNIEGDLAYTIRAWPNHHRALNSLIKYYFRQVRKGESTHLPPECWFQRAINFSPRDASTYTLYGIFLHQKGLYPAAKEQYENALNIKPDHPEIQYNYALLLVEMENYEEALVFAKKAYGAGYPLPGLKNKLTELGYWE